ncbi:MAG: XisI protein [Cyanobacteriota bacterium]|nr:XisI protein [Cyanobacteriota bacterium]
MEKLNRYRELIKRTLTEYHKWASNTPQDGIEECIAFDEIRDHYFWFHTGWNGKHRVRGVAIYLRIRNGKIWVEEDWTKQGVVNDLLSADVPPEDIVLGFQHPSKRPLTEFAIA